MQFHDAFPTLTFGKKLTDLLQFVTVDRIAINQAKNRAKWRAAHARYTFRNKAEEMTAVRECEVLKVTRAEQ